MKQTDIVVIGGGIVGASIAWALARRSAGSITLLEKSTIAAEASGKTGALLRRHYSNEPEARLALLGQSIFRDWKREVGGDCGFVPESIVVTVDCSAGHEANLARLRANIAMLQALGVTTQVISGDELEAMQPFLNADDIPFAAFEPDSGYVNAIAATRSMALAAVNQGVTILEGTRVESIVAAGGAVSGVRTSIGDLAAEIVICAAGPWTPALFAGLGLNVPIDAYRVQIAIVQRPMALETGHFVYIDTAAGMFTRPWGPGTSLIGVGGGDQHDRVDPDDYSPMNDATYPALAIAAAAKRIPAMAHGAYLHGHAGLYDMTPDAHPIIGDTPVAGLHVAAGFSGAGFKKGPAVGLCLADSILGDPPAVGLAPFALGRFDDNSWNRPWSDTEYTFSSDFGHKF